METGIEDVRKLLDTISSLEGEQLSGDIFYGQVSIANKGTLITPKLISRLQELDPTRLRFSTHVMTRPDTDKDVARLVTEQVSPNVSELLADAEIKEIISTEAHTQATRKVKKVFEACRYMTKLDMVAMADLALDLIKRVANLTNSAFKLTQLRNYDEYTYFHSVNTCVLATAVFRNFVDSDEELLEISTGMLIHDVGKSKVALKILNKPGPLTKEEFEIMTRHVVYGHNLIKDNFEVSPTVKDIILNHHEYVNGQGYTRGLKEKDLKDHDLIAAVCDVFDAVTTKRVYRAAVDVHRAVSLLIRGSGIQFSTRVVNHFLSGIGRFPVGTFVILSNNEIGVVAQIHDQALSLPIIKVLYDGNGSKLSVPRTVDLYLADGIYIDQAIDLYGVATNYESIIRQQS